MDKDNPHACLGLQKGRKQICLYCPEQEEVYLEVFGKRVVSKSLGKGLFEYHSPVPLNPLDYRIQHRNGLIAHDPYAFAPTFGIVEASPFHGEEPWKIWEVMGGRLCTHQGAEGVKFSVWAPHALEVSLIGDFNGWDIKKNPMRKLAHFGIWELFVPGLGEGMLYKFAVQTADGQVHFKADPYAYRAERCPQTASVIARIDRHLWEDSEWMERRRRDPSTPLNIYKLHIGCWKTEGGAFKTYRELAPLLADFVKEMGFTHVELLPVMEHPLDESWGYEVTGYYAISSRYGSVEDFQYFVDFLHQRGIGVFFDWVPAHFPRDAHGMARFDGTCLYEHADPHLGYQPKWDTLIFDYSKREVRNFLIGSALFYLEIMHVDGLRVDAVSSIIYLDFERKEGEWQPNAKGGNENFAGITFLKELNRTVHAHFPTALRIAEESHACVGVTDPNGLGFDLRWDLGWSADVLKFFATSHANRSQWFHLLVDEMGYFYSHRHLLPLSHDDVSCGKGSLLSKMPGTEWERFANLRLLLSYQMTHPGKKLLFMGGELGQIEEWSVQNSLPWDLLFVPAHRGIYACVGALNHFYLAHPALYAEDFSPKGFEWIRPLDTNHLVLIYLRKGGGESLLCVHNFSPNILENYRIPYSCRPIELFSTDLKQYGGSGIVNAKIKIETKGFLLIVPPLATLILAV